MKYFECPACSERVFFANLNCNACGASLMYTPVSDSFRVTDSPCQKRETIEQCNWESANGNTFCLSCSLDVDETPTELTVVFQQSKRRTLRQLHRLGIQPSGIEPRLLFALEEGTANSPVTTGHSNGLITLDVSEGDAEHLQRIQDQMSEPYRTPLGHVRHELGHWFWQAMAGSLFELDHFRSVFGDENTPYQQALKDHYAQLDDGSWKANYISFYASSHPWEDFAESFAHFLHIDGTLETMQSSMQATDESDRASFETRYSQWVPVTTLINELNLSMGMPEPYPFAPSQIAVDKIRFVAEAFQGNNKR